MQVLAKVGNLLRNHALKDHDYITKFAAFCEILKVKCVYVCIYVCMYVCMYVCVYACTYVRSHLITIISPSLLRSVRCWRYVVAHTYISMHAECFQDYISKFAASYISKFAASYISKFAASYISKFAASYISKFAASCIFKVSSVYVVQSYIYICTYGVQICIDTQYIHTYMHRCTRLTWWSWTMWWEYIHTYIDTYIHTYIHA